MSTKRKSGTSAAAGAADKRAKRSVSGTAAAVASIAEYRHRHISDQLTYGLQAAGYYRTARRRVRRRVRDWLRKEAPRRSGHKHKAIAIGTACDRIWQVVGPILHDKRLIVASPTRVCVWDMNRADYDTRTVPSFELKQLTASTAADAAAAAAAASITDTQYIFSL